MEESVRPSSDTETTTNGALASFQSSLADLNQISSFGGRTATSSDEDIATITASDKASTGSYELAVTQLAKGHSLASGAYTSAADTVGTGTLTISCEPLGQP